MGFFFGHFLPSHANVFKCVLDRSQCQVSVDAIFTNFVFWALLFTFHSISSVRKSQVTQSHRWAGFLFIVSFLFHRVLLMLLLLFSLRILLGTFGWLHKVRSFIGERYGNIWKSYVREFYAKPIVCFPTKKKIEKKNTKLDTTILIALPFAVSIAVLCLWVADEMNVFVYLQWRRTKRKNKRRKK